MPKNIPITKADAIRRKSGLTVNDFMENMGYSRETWKYWQKNGISQSAYARIQAHYILGTPEPKATTHNPHPLNDLLTMVHNSPRAETVTISGKTYWLVPKE
jgi:hypothetical protein